MGEAAGVQNKKSTENMDFINNSRRICRNGKANKSQKHSTSTQKAHKVGQVHPIWATKAQRGSRGIALLFL